MKNFQEEIVYKEITFLNLKFSTLFDERCSPTRQGSIFQYGTKEGELSQYMSQYWRQDPGAPASQISVRGGAQKRIEHMKAKRMLSMAHIV